MTPHPPSDDPRGYRLDLADALAGGSAAAVAFALARCLTAGVSVPDDLRRKADEVPPSAMSAVVAEIGRWTEAARSLGRRWDAADDPWEADELVRTLVELRTDAEGLRAVLGDGVRVAVEAFDDALKAEEGLVSTLVGTPWLEGYRKSVPNVAAGWWLNPRAEPPELPPAGFYAIVERVRAWKAGEPAVEAPLAADTDTATAPPRLRSFEWRSAAGRYFAQLDVLTCTTAEHRRTAKYPLVFKRTAGGRATELAGTLVRLGRVSGVMDPNGELTATLDDWWADSDGRLYVGEPLDEWPLAGEPG
jgi:hypothetical protein